MMYRIAFAGFLVCFTTSVLFAQEQVTLKTGTQLIGRVSLSADSRSVTLKIGESSISVPMDEVDSIGPVGSKLSPSPDRLLMIALESQLQHGSGAGQIGLLAEAYRQAPQDARIAYWYARSLVDARLGSTAQKIVEEHRQAIEVAYPGILAKLEEEISQRVSLEGLPADFVKRIDQITDSIGRSLPREDRIPMFVRFALVDSDGVPLERQAYRISASGAEERLETFAQGNHLFSFNLYRGNENHSCKLTVSGPGLKSQTFDLPASSVMVADAGRFEVKRYIDSEMVTRTFLVLNENDKPIPGANIHLSIDSRGPQPTEKAITDESGRATIKQFPLEYQYLVENHGYLRDHGKVAFREGIPSDEIVVKLFPLMNAKARIAWVSQLLQGPTASTNGESVLTLGRDPSPHP
jgi:hypothetical protein